MKSYKNILFTCLVVFQIHGMNPPRSIQLLSDVDISNELPYPLRSRLKRKSDEIAQSEDQSRSQCPYLLREHSNRNAPAKRVPPKKRLKQLNEYSFSQILPKDCEISEYDKDNDSSFLNRIVKACASKLGISRLNWENLINKDYQVKVFRNPDPTGFIVYSNMCQDYI